MTPVMLRGQMYNTRKAFRCQAFSECHVCHQCDNYNKNLAICVYCEGKKNPDLLCNHTDEQQQKVLQIQLMFDRPLFNVDDDLNNNDLQKGITNEKELLETEEILANIGAVAKER